MFITWYIWIENGPRVVFTVTGTTDKLENNKWTTELKTICRMVND